MSQQTGQLRVVVSPDGFYPQSLRWAGRTVRVRYLENVQTCGLERRYRVHTGEGLYELSWHMDTEAWQIRRTPTWLSRAWARLQRMPRYPLPAGRRRLTVAH